MVCWSDVKDRPHTRAARRGRSMEAEVRAIREEAVSETEGSGDLFTNLLERFGELGGVELELPPRSTVRRDVAHYSRIVNARERIGSPIDGFDAQIAAIRRTHRTPLATRNLKDFVDTGVDLIDPWAH
ncbi:FitA-like ribbon-helix-helix domain-containing protein [Spiractinospora alimapuensis]|uniref:FitA-like ribbon-helix-helix domain-containing protein n=1 Tax=Spiractinospora alimapuensis TaxID=2820884 RepID=UPI00374495C7